MLLLLQSLQLKLLHNVILAAICYRLATSSPAVWNAYLDKGRYHWLEQCFPMASPPTGSHGCGVSWRSLERSNHPALPTVAKMVPLLCPLTITLEFPSLLHFSVPFSPIVPPRRIRRLGQDCEANPFRRHIRQINSVLSLSVAGINISII